MEETWPDLRAVRDARGDWARDGEAESDAAEQDTGGFGSRSPSFVLLRTTADICQTICTSRYRFDGPPVRLAIVPSLACSRGVFPRDEASSPRPVAEKRGQLKFKKNKNHEINFDTRVLRRVIAAFRFMS